MKHIALLTCVCGLMLLGSCKNQSAQNEQPLEVMTFNVRLDAPSDSANNWKYRKDNVCQMITYYQPDLLGMQEVRHNQMETCNLGTAPSPQERRSVSRNSKADMATAPPGHPHRSI